MANHLRVGASYSAAIELARPRPPTRPSAPSRLDLRARALGLEGVARAKRGDFEGGLETVRGGLALALEHDLTPVAAELYQRLSLVLYDSADYRARRGDARHRARAVPRRRASAGTEVACVTLPRLRAARVRRVAGGARSWAAS